MQKTSYLRTQPAMWIQKPHGSKHCDLEEARTPPEALIRLRSKITVASLSPRAGFTRNRCRMTPDGTNTQFGTFAFMKCRTVIGDCSVIVRFERNQVLWPIKQCPLLAETRHSNLWIFGVASVRYTPKAATQMLGLVYYWEAASNPKRTNAARRRYFSELNEVVSQ
jgi:hypothetical protein